MAVPQLGRIFLESMAASVRYRLRSLGGVGLLLSDVDPPLPRSELAKPRISAACCRFLTRLVQQHADAHGRDAGAVATTQGIRGGLPTPAME